MERTWPLRQQYAWLVVGAVGSTVSSFSGPLEDAVGSPAAVCIYLVGGVLLGGLWYVLSPRPLGERARAVGRIVAIYLTFWLLLLLVSLLWGSGGDDSWSVAGPAIAVLPGLPLGLWLAERRATRAVTRTPVLR
ncbi:hypothetical protein [Nocardioides marmorisolisilvae]|uniref:Uncharacterized protein n=1 Tax=Nocardioides marmorisolisilvae TaxID=1542737 RepID=A0A3N0DRT9_9ACTN|nr:hypothetical protein [Nocardioides marmorisolisilvae]RNL78349.1 hypothetical protein EFL95_04390 [Nocardioides marmorisolisilvae]